MRVNEGLFGFTISITHNSVFLPHNSKYVSLMKKKKTLLRFVFSFCFYYSILWFLSNKLWKLKTYFRCFWFPKLSFQWHFHNLTHIPSCNVWQTDFFFLFGETQPQCLTNSLIFFFFFFWGKTEPQLLKLKTGFELRCQIGGLGNWGILSDKWWVMKIEQWKLSDDKLQTKRALTFYTPRVFKNFLSLCHVVVFYWVNKIRVTNLRGT